jgi:hypothetical protein
MAPLQQDHREWQLGPPRAREHRHRQLSQREDPGRTVIHPVGYRQVTLHTQVLGSASRKGRARIRKPGGSISPASKTISIRFHDIGHLIARGQRVIWHRQFVSPCARRSPNLPRTGSVCRAQVPSERFLSLGAGGAVRRVQRPGVENRSISGQSR